MIKNFSGLVTIFCKKLIIKILALVISMSGENSAAIEEVKIDVNDGKEEKATKNELADR